MTLWPDAACCVVKTPDAAGPRGRQRILPAAPDCRPSRVCSPDAWKSPAETVVRESTCASQFADADIGEGDQPERTPTQSLEAQLVQAQAEARRLKTELEQERERSQKRAQRIQELLVGPDAEKESRSMSKASRPDAEKESRSVSKASRAESDALSSARRIVTSEGGMPASLADVPVARAPSLPHRFSQVNRTSRIFGDGGDDSLLSQMLNGGAKAALCDEDLLEALNGTLSKDVGSTGEECAKEQFEWMFVVVLPNPRLDEMQDIRHGGITEFEAAHVFDTCFKGEDTHHDVLRQAECFDQEKRMFLSAFNALPDAGDDHLINNEAEAESHGQEALAMHKTMSLEPNAGDVIPEAQTRVNEALHGAQHQLNRITSLGQGLRGSMEQGLRGSMEQGLRGPSQNNRRSVISGTIALRKPKKKNNAVAMIRMSSEVFRVKDNLRKMVLHDSLEKPPKRFAGEEPEDSAWYGQVRAGEGIVERAQKSPSSSPNRRMSEMSVRDGEFTRAQNFLELLRNQIVIKLAMHAQLATRMCFSEDGESILLLVTCRPADLLVEAESQSFPAELELRHVDPKSLEPCCSRSFYPLLDWYLGRCPSAPVAEVARSYRKVLDKIRDAPEEERRERQREVEFWESAERHLTRSGSVTTRKHLIREKDHIYGTDKHRRLVLKAFLQYLELKADIGLGADPQELMRTVNSGYRKPVLVNWHGALELGTPSPPYKVFRRSSYEGANGKPWEFCSYEACSRQKDEVVFSPFSGANRAKLTKSIMDRQVNLGQLLAYGYVSSIFPLDTREKVEDIDTGEPSKLHKTWSVPVSASRWVQLQVFLQTMFLRVEVDCVRHYFGERIALYFALLDAMSWGLVLPGVVGGAAWAVQQLVPYEPHREEAPLVAVVTNLIYSTVIAAWSTWMLQMWKRKQAMFAHRWGQTDTRRVEMPRPHFRGHPTRSPVTYDDAELKFSLRKRAIRQVVSFCALTVLCILEMFGTYWLGDLRSNWVKNRWRFHRYSQSITGVCFTAQMFLAEEIGLRCAKSFNDWENYKTQEQYLNALILKAVGHELFNRFHAYFWIAFSKASSHGCLVLEGEGVKFLGPEGMNGRMCLYELKVQLQTVMLVEFLKNVNVVFKPVIGSTMRNLRRAATARDDYEVAVDNESGAAKMSHFCQAAIDRPGYGELEVDGTFEDYLDVVTLFGHFTLFSLCFPLAPTIGFILLVMRLRVDGLKLYELLRRPLPASAEHVGNWYQVMHAMTWFAMVANALLTVYTFGSFDDPPGHFSFLGPLPKYVFFVFFAGALTLIKVCVMFLVPERPQNIRIAQLHHEWVRDQLDLVSQEGPRTDESRSGPEHLHLEVGSSMSGQWRPPLMFGQQGLRQRKGSFGP